MLVAIVEMQERRLRKLPVFANEGKSGGIEIVFNQAARMIVLGATFLLCACAITEDKVPVDFVPASTPSTVAGAESVTVSVTAADRRQQYADRIGTKKNAYGMEMARISASNDVVDLVRRALEQQLKAQGFRVDPGGLAVAIEVQNFYNNFQLGLLAGTAVAEVSFSLKVRDGAGRLIYQQFYSGVGRVEGVMLAGGNNAKAGVEKALGDAIEKATSDVEFQKALLPKPAPAGGRRVGA